MQDLTEFDSKRTIRDCFGTPFNSKIICELDVRFENCAILSDTEPGVFRVLESSLRYVGFGLAAEWMVLVEALGELGYGEVLEVLDRSIKGGDIACCCCFAYRVLL